VTGRERLDTDTRIFRAHVETRSLCHNIKKHFHTTQTHKNVCDCSECVCVCVRLLKKRAAAERVSLWAGLMGQTAACIFGKH
jgi:hypothetical protein